MEWIILCLAIVLGIAFFAEHEARDKAQREAENNRKRAEKEAIELANEKELAEWVQVRQTEGWAYIARGKLMHVEGQPDCIMSLSKDAPLLRFDQFELDAEVQFDDPFYINLNQIISLDVKRPKVTKTRYESVPVPITSSKTKSPVARGLLGGALLGPAGLIVGAASGLNADTNTEVRHERVSRKYEGLGAPQLIIGTSSDEYPVLKIRCSNQQVADEWMFRLRGRQARMR